MTVTYGVTRFLGGGGWFSRAENLPLSCFCAQLASLPPGPGDSVNNQEFLPLGALLQPDRLGTLV